MLSVPIHPPPHPLPAKGATGFGMSGLRYQIDQLRRALAQLCLVSHAVPHARVAQLQMELAHLTALTRRIIAERQPASSLARGPAQPSEQSTLHYSHAHSASPSAVVPLSSSVSCRDTIASVADRLGVDMESDIRAHNPHLRHVAHDAGLPNNTIIKLCAPIAPSPLLSRSSSARQSDLTCLSMISSSFCSSTPSLTRQEIVPTVLTHRDSNNENDCNVANYRHSRRSTTPNRSDDNRVGEESADQPRLRKANDAGHRGREHCERTTHAKGADSVGFRDISQSAPLSNTTRSAVNTVTLLASSSDGHDRMSAMISVAGNDHLRSARGCAGAEAGAPRCDSNPVENAITTMASAPAGVAANICRSSTANSANPIITTAMTGEHNTSGPLTQAGHTAHTSAGERTAHCEPSITYAGARPTFASASLTDAISPLLTPSAPCAATIPSSSAQDGTSARSSTESGYSTTQKSISATSRLSHHSRSNTKNDKSDGNNAKEKSSMSNNVENARRDGTAIRHASNTSRVSSNDKNYSPATRITNNNRNNTSCQHQYNSNSKIVIHSISNATPFVPVVSCSLDRSSSSNGSIGGCEAAAASGGQERTPHQRSMCDDRDSSYAFSELQSSPEWLSASKPPAYAPLPDIPHYQLDSTHRRVKSVTLITDAVNISSSNNTTVGADTATLSRMSSEFLCERARETKDDTHNYYAIDDGDEDSDDMHDAPAPSDAADGMEEWARQGHALHPCTTEDNGDAVAGTEQHDGDMAFIADSPQSHTGAHDELAPMRGRSPGGCTVHTNDADVDRRNMHSRHPSDNDIIVHRTPNAQRSTSRLGTRMGSSEHDNNTSRCTTHGVDTVAHTPSTHLTTATAAAARVEGAVEENYPSSAQTLDTPLYPAGELSPSPSLPSILFPSPTPPTTTEQHALSERCVSVTQRDSAARSALTTPRRVRASCSNSSSGVKYEEQTPHACLPRQLLYHQPTCQPPPVSSRYLATLASTSLCRATLPICDMTTAAEKRCLTAEDNMPRDRGSGEAMARASARHARDDDSSRHNSDKDNDTDREARQETPTNATSSDNRDTTTRHTDACAAAIAVAHRCRVGDTRRQGADSGTRVQEKVIPSSLVATASAEQSHSPPNSQPSVTCLSAIASPVALSPFSHTSSSCGFTGTVQVTQAATTAAGVASSLSSMSISSVIPDAMHLWNHETQRSKSHSYSRYPACHTVHSNTTTAPTDATTTTAAATTASCSNHHHSSTNNSTATRCDLRDRVRHDMDDTHDVAIARSSQHVGSRDHESAVGDCGSVTPVPRTLPRQFAHPFVSTHAPSMNEKVCRVREADEPSCSPSPQTPPPPPVLTLATTPQEYEAHKRVREAVADDEEEDRRSHGEDVAAPTQLCLLAQDTFSRKLFTSTESPAPAVRQHHRQEQEQYTSMQSLQPSAQTRGLSRGRMGEVSVHDGVRCCCFSKPPSLHALHSLSSRKSMLLAAPSAAVPALQTEPIARNDWAAVQEPKDCSHSDGVLLPALLQTKGVAAATADATPDTNSSRHDAARRCADFDDDNDACAAHSSSSARDDSGTERGEPDSPDTDDEYDTIEKIAHMYNTTVDEVLRWNQYLSAYRPNEPLPPDLSIVLAVAKQG